jgi:phosphoglycolate phosphatase-like HAD superfamily hydrolase
VADDAIFVGDSPHDIESGNAAGVYTIGVSWGAFSAKSLEESGADAVVDDIAGLQKAIAHQG